MDMAQIMGQPDCKLATFNLSKTNARELIMSARADMIGLYQRANADGERTLKIFDKVY